MKARSSTSTSNVAELRPLPKIERSSQGVLIRSSLLRRPSGSEDGARGGSSGFSSLTHRMQLGLCLVRRGSLLRLKLSRRRRWSLTRRSCRDLVRLQVEEILRHTGALPRPSDHCCGCRWHRSRRRRKWKRERSGGSSKSLGTTV